MDATVDKDVALPMDVQACHAMILQLLAGQRDQSRTIHQLEHQLGELLRRLYGRSSEKLDPAQLTLFVEMLRQLQGQEAVAPAHAPVLIAPAVPAAAFKPVKTRTADGSSPRTCRGSGSSTTFPRTRSPAPAAARRVAGSARWSPKSSNTFRRG